MTDTLLAIGVVVGLVSVILSRDLIEWFVDRRMVRRVDRTHTHDGVRADKAIHPRSGQ